MADDDERHDEDDALLGRWMKMKVPGFVKMIAGNNVDFRCRDMHEIRIRYQLPSKDIRHSYRHSYVYRAGISGPSMFMFKLKHISTLNSLLNACKHSNVCVDCIRMKGSCLAFVLCSCSRSIHLWYLSYIY